MTDPQQPEKSSDADSPDQDGTQAQAPADAQASAEDQAPAAAQAPAEDQAPTEDEAPTGTDAAASATAPTPPADDAPPARSRGRKGVLLGVGGVVLVAAAAAFVVTAFFTPGFLAGPGSPDATAAQATAALAGRNAQELERVSCHGPDGKPITSVPPGALEQIQSATQTGPPSLALDTQALAPIDLSVAAPGGQPQTLPAQMQLGVTDGAWCLTGIAQRQ